MKNLFKSAVVHILALGLISLGSPVIAEAGIISTLSAVEAQGRSEDLATINAALARDEVRSELTALGVESSQIDARLAALTDSELRSLAERIATMPAGGDALAVIGIVFIVLLILEAVGVLDIFKKFP
jgi:hypothetical protein